MTNARRFFTFLLVLIASLAGISAAQNPHKKHAPQGQYLAYVGTYTTKTDSKGIYAYRFDAAAGQLSAIGLAAETGDPSFVAVHPSGKRDAASRMARLRGVIATNGTLPSNTGSIASNFRSILKPAACAALAF